MNDGMIDTHCTRVLFRKLMEKSSNKSRLSDKGCWISWPDASLLCSYHSLVAGAASMSSSMRMAHGRLRLI